MLIVILGLPRTGSSALCKILENSNVSPHIYSKKIEQKSYEFNKIGYFEDTFLNLLNDNLIRSIYGVESSFLYNKMINPKINKMDDNFFYDIDENSLEIPDDYLLNFEKYTGHSWDVWGLSRMQKNEKWYKCYSKTNCADSSSIKNTLGDYKESLLNQSERVSTYIKDQRIIYAYKLWDLPENTKFIILDRNENDSIKSLRNHYGKNLFTEKNYFNFTWVSNHFNYKVKYQSYEEYSTIFNEFANLIRSNYDVLDLTFEDSKFFNDVDELSKFLNTNIVYKDIF